jgi:hypothetical protein
VSHPAAPHRRVLPRRELERACAPERLDLVLAALVARGAIGGFRVDRHRVALWGLLGAEVALDLAQHAGEAPSLSDDARAAYYLRCRDFMRTGAFRRLPALHRAVWRLHADGASLAQIAVELRVTVQRVRDAVSGARTTAKLPRSTSSMPRGGGPGRPRKSSRCAEPACPHRPRSRGLCARHYKRSWRRSQGKGG